MHDLTQTKLIQSFECLGDKCEDTCCKNWSMQVDDATLKRYQESKAELLQWVDRETDGIPVMKRDPATQQCVKLESGWCGLHKEFGSNMLGDACHFYPRVTRSLGTQTRMTATTSCPEVVRLMVSLDTPFADEHTATERLPSVVKDYLPDALKAAQATTIHHAFLAAAGDETVSPSQSLARISSVARSMPMLDNATWDQSIPLYLKLADSRLPKAESYNADHFNLLHALCGLIVASKKNTSDRLRQTIADMEEALGATLDWQQVQIATSEDSLEKLETIQNVFDAAKDMYTPVLRRYLQAQISLTLFPFSGLGNNPEERITFIGVRFALIKLALACAHALHGELPQDDVVRIIQSISRIMDHLGDPKFSLSIYQETGWIKEARLLAII